LGTRHRKIDTGNIGHKTQKDTHWQHWAQETERDTRVTMGTRTQKDRHGYSVSSAHCFPCLSFCVFFPLLPVSIFLCLVPNVTRVYLSVSCAQCFPCLSFCVLFPMIHVSIFLCLVPNVIRVYHSVSCVQCCQYLSFCVLCPLLPVSIFLTQKDRHGKHWAQDTER
jgi:hypothetical protein